MHAVGLIDIVVFLVFVAAVIIIGLWKSQGEETHGDKGAQNYFLAGRGLTWWLVGFSLIAANISTEQFVGMSGKAADWLGMAIASYEWMAAITLVVVAFVFLPTFLRSGIYTIPEFLEYRYNAFARSVMAVFTLVILVGVPTASVIFSGAKVITGNFQGMAPMGLDLGNITVGCWIIGTLAAVYVFAGGLKACAWADLLQGSALILGGVVIALFAMKYVADADPNELMKTARNKQVTVESLKNSGPIKRFWDLNKGPLPEGKVHMVRSSKDPEIPWTALIVGLWIPNFFYWGLNQYITQRTLGSKSLSRRPKGSSVRRVPQTNRAIRCRCAGHAGIQLVRPKLERRCGEPKCGGFGESKPSALQTADTEYVAQPEHPTQQDCPRSDQAGTEQRPEVYGGASIQIR